MSPPQARTGTSKVGSSDDTMYFFVRVRDDYQWYTVTPEECVSH